VDVLLALFAAETDGLEEAVGGGGGDKLDLAHATKRALRPTGETAVVDQVMRLAKVAGLLLLLRRGERQQSRRRRKINKGLMDQPPRIKRGEVVISNKN